MSEQPTAATAESAPIYEPRRYVCIGRRYDMAEQELSVQLIEFDPSEPLDQRGRGNVSVFAVNKITRHLYAGACYDIPTALTPEGGRTIQATLAVYVSKWHDTGEAGAWQLETETADALAEAAARHKRETAPANAQLLQMLAPLRKTYTETIGTARRLAMELAVLKALRTPPGKGGVQ